MIAGFHTTAFPEHDWGTARGMLQRIGYTAIGVRLSRARLNPVAEASRREQQIGLLVEQARAVDGAAEPNGSARGTGARVTGARRSAPSGNGSGGDASQRSRHPIRWILDADGPFLLDPWSPDIGDLMQEGPRRERRIECIAGAIAFAARLGGSLVTFASGPLPPNLDSQQGLDRLAEAILRITSLAERAGIAVAIRPRPEHFVDSVGRYERLVEWLQGRADLQLAADVGTMVAGGELPIVDLLVRNPRLACVYLSEVRWVAGGRGQADALIGSSHVAADRVAAGLAEHDFAGPLLVEPAHAQAVDPTLAAALYERIFGQVAGSPSTLDPHL